MKVQLRFHKFSYLPKMYDVIIKNNLIERGKYGRKEHRKYKRKNSSFI